MSNYKTQIITSSLEGIVSPVIANAVKTAVDNWSQSGASLEIKIPEVQDRAWAIDVSDIEESSRGVDIWSIGCGAGQYELSGDFLYILPEEWVNLQLLKGDYVCAPVEAQEANKRFEKFNEFITKNLAYSAGGVTISTLAKEDEECDWEV
jgi:hypothetical protein